MPFINVRNGLDSLANTAEILGFEHHMRRGGQNIDHLAILQMQLQVLLKRACHYC